MLLQHLRQFLSIIKGGGEEGGVGSIVGVQGITRDHTVPYEPDFRVRHAFAHWTLCSWRLCNKPDMWAMLYGLFDLSPSGMFAVCAISSL